MPDSSPDILSSVREELLGEALRSPGLLSDVANLERYVAESYSARSFIELLQNADDAEAKRFMVTRHGEWLVCANDGRAFSRQDFYSLCRSASSAKQRGQTIGYRGIGFKSVVGVASSVHLLSSNLRVTFSRELTRNCLGNDTSPPLVRIPHPLALKQGDPIFASIHELQQAGYTTLFVLGGLDTERVQDEFDQFDADYLLFLRHIIDAKLDGATPRSYHCQRQSTNANSRVVSIGGPDRRSSWRIEHVGECDIAYSLLDGNPVPLNAASAIAHAFLPTLESTGFGVRINADFSTDPSRTRIIFDDTTLACIDDAAEAIAANISQAVLSPNSDKSLLACLSPTADLATLALQKRSFRTELISRVKKKLDHLKEKIALAPSWLNSTDAQNLASSLDRVVLEPPPNQREAQTNFMRYLGVKALSAENVLKSAETTPLSSQGCADIVTHCVRNVASGISMRQLIEKPVWRSDKTAKPASLTSLTTAGESLDKDVIAAINASGIASEELGRMLKSAGVKEESVGVVLPGVVLTSQTPPQNAPNPANIESVAIPSPAAPLVDPLLHGAYAPNGGSGSANIITSRSLPAWRGAEQYVAIMLSEHGYSVEDRSRQNLGYDLYAEKEGLKYYVEVKLLDYAGQPFIITTNEEAVARECGDSYAIALVLRDASNNDAHIRFFRDPTRTFKFVRQCRQWVWECSEYGFN